MTADPEKQVAAYRAIAKQELCLALEVHLITKVWSHMNLIINKCLFKIKTMSTKNGFVPIIAMDLLLW